MRSREPRSGLPDGHLNLFFEKAGNFASANETNRSLALFAVFGHQKQR